MLHILGANGIVHNGSLLKPNASCDRVDLADGDKLQISKHTLSFSYPSLRPDPPKEVATPSPPRSPRRGRQCKADSPVTPRRQSARLKAKYSSPCLKASAMSPHAESIQCTHSKAAELDASANASLMQLADEVATESNATAPDAAPSGEATDGIPTSQKLMDASEEKHASDTLEKPFSGPIEAQESFPTSAEAETVESSQIPEPFVLQKEEQKTDLESHLEKPTGPTSFADSDHPVEQVATAPTKPLDLVLSQQEDSELSLAVETVTPSGEDDSVQTLHLDDMEAAAVADNLLNESPSSASSPASPQTSHARMPSALPFAMPRTPPLQWTPSKSRKVSLRTATLLKRSAQYPLVPLSEMRGANQSTVPMNRSPIVPRTSTGSRDMDMTRNFGDDASSDSDVSSEDEDEIDRSLGSSGSGPEFERPKTPEPNQRAPVLANFFTPQQPRQRTLRRMSNPDTSASTPKLKSRSSWQWLRDLFKSPTTRDEKQTDAQPSPITRDKKQTDAQPSDNDKESSTVLGSEHLASEAAASTTNDLAQASDEFFDVENEVDSAEAYEPMDIEVPSTTPDVTLTNTSWMYQLPSSPAPHRVLDDHRTPDMQELKHMFAEPPQLASESILSDFRHVMRPDATPENDFSLTSAWNTLTGEPEEHDGPWHDVSEEPVSLHPPQADPGSHEVEVPSGLLSSEEKGRKDETEKGETGRKEGASDLSSDVPQGTTVTPDNLVTTPETKSASKQSAPIVPLLAVATTLPPMTRHETTIETPPPKSEYLKERTTNEIMANPAENKTDDQRAASASIPSKDVEKTRTKVRAEAVAPVRMSPRRAATQAQRVRTEAVPATRSSGMAPRAVSQKEPYVPVRRRLPARAAVSNLGTMATTATRASRTRVADSKEQVHGPDASASDTIGRRVTGHASSIPLAANGRRPTSTLQRNDTTSSKPGSTRGAGARTARTARSSRQV